VKTPDKSLPDEREWNFDPVGDDEIELCFLYEYGREHAKASAEWLKLVRKYSKKPQIELAMAITRIFGTTTLPWFCLPEFTQTPWQALERTLRKQQAKEFEQRANSAPSFQQFIALTVTLQRDLHEYSDAGATDFESWVALDKAFHDDDDQREHGFFAINWNFTNGELEAQFAQWLSDARGDRQPSESKRGTVKMRAQLNALGAKRVRDAGFTVKEAMRETGRCRKDTHGNPRPLYSSERAWSKAKCETVPAVLQRLFPAAR